MNAPNYIQRELRAINPKYFAVFDPSPRLSDGRIDTRGRWLIRKWLTSHPISQRIENWRMNSIPILTVKEDDGTGRDIGYRDIDMRVIHTINEGLWNAAHHKELLGKIDRANDLREMQLKAEEDYQHRYAAKRMWHHYREPTVFLGG